MEKPFIPHLPRNIWVFFLVDIIYTAISFVLLSIISLEPQLADPYSVLKTAIPWLKGGLHWARWWRKRRDRSMTGDALTDELELGNVADHDGG